MNVEPHPLPALLLAPLFSRSLTLVPRSFLLNRTEKLATQANETFSVALCHRDFALIGYFALPIVFSGIWLAWTSCPIFLKLDSLPICKGKSYLKLSKLILNWTVRKLHCLNFVSSPENETLGRVCLSCEESSSSVSLSMLKVPNSTWTTQWRSYIAPPAPETTKWYNRSSGLGGQFNLV